MNHNELYDSLNSVYFSFKAILGFQKAKNLLLLLLFFFFFLFLSLWSLYGQ